MGNIFVRLTRWVHSWINALGPVTYNITANYVIIGDYGVVNAQSSNDQVSHDGSAMGCDEANAEITVGSQLHSTPYRLPPPGVEPQLIKVFNQMTKVVDKLYPLRDGGKWNEFDQALNVFQSNYESQPEIKYFLTFEKCVRLTYQKRLEEGRKMAKDALNIVNNEIHGISRDVLRLLGNVALASTFRRKGEEKSKLGSASKYLGRAQQSGERLRGIDSTIIEFALLLLNYEQGRSVSEFAEIANKPRSAKVKASRFYKLCIDRCRKLSGRLYIAKQYFALIFLARLSVPTSTASKKLSVEKTRGYLEKFNRSRIQVKDTPLAAEIKYSMIESHLCHLAGNYSRAEEYAHQALQVAKQYGFDLEIAPAQDQIDHICVSRTSQAKLQVKNISCNSSTKTDSD